MVFATLQRNSPFVLFVIPFFLLGLWMKHILHPMYIPMYYDENPMPLYGFIMKLGTWSSVAYTIANLCWISINMLILTRLNTVHRLIEKGTFIYLFVYILITASFPIFQQLNPIQPAVSFVLLGILSIYKMYKNERGLRPVYEAGFLFGIAALFYANALFLGIFIFAGLFSLVPLNWRQWMSGILGLATPIFFIFTWYFLKDGIPEFMQVIKENTVIWKRSTQIHYSQLIVMGVLLLLMFGSLINSFSVILKKVSSKKYYGLFLTFIILVISIYFAVPAAGTEIFYFATIPVIFYVANYMVYMRSRALQEIFFILLIISSILVQFLR